MHRAFLFLLIALFATEAKAQPPAEAPTTEPTADDEGDPDAPDAPDAPAAADEDEAPQEGESSESEAHESTGDETPAESTVELVPPQVVTSPPPPYPQERLREGLHPEVVLLVTIAVDGQATDIVVDHGADPEFDAIAVATVRDHWTFSPARRGDEPIVARVRVAVHFDLPTFEPAAVGATQPEDRTAPDHRGEEAHVARTGPDVADPGADAQPADGADELGEGLDQEFTAEAEVELDHLRDRSRGASDLHVRRDVLEAAPHEEGADLLRTVPGLLIQRAEGDAVAHRISLRGFDAEHGQDLEIRVGGLPVNLPSHIHGQGYADLGFLIPEVVREVRVIEGIGDPHQGDFAVAGSVDLALGVEDRGIRAKTTLGSFRSFRQLALWAPKSERADTFAAIELHRTRGFGQNRSALGGSAIMQYGFGHRGWRFRLTGIGRATRAQLAGVVRQDDIDAGRVGFYDSYPDATTQSQNALNLRMMFGFQAVRRYAEGANAELGFFLSFDDFRLQENFTGYLQRSRFNPDWVGRGDLIEQTNRTTTFGFNARYRSSETGLGEHLKVQYELGLQSRLDLIDQAQNLLAAPSGETWDERIDASVRGVDLGLFADVTLDIASRAVLRVGVRSDALFYDVDDRLGRRIPDFRADSHIIGFRRSAFGLVAGPRTSLIVKLGRGVSLLTSYGEGYRSPQARTLADGETAPFTKVRSADLGVRLERDWIDLRIAGYFTRLSDDLAFEAREARLERVGASRRLGATLHLTVRPTDWLVASGSVTYVDAELLEPPPPSAEDPSPPFTAGQNLPFVPPWVLRLDVGAKHTLAKLGSFDLDGRAGFGLTHIAPRPLPFGGEAEPFTTVDLNVGLKWGHLGLGLALFNLFDAQYAAAAFNIPSHFRRGTPRSRLPSRLISAGRPRTAMFTLEITL